MYAIIFDLKTKELENNWKKADNDIAIFLSDYGFSCQQGSIYFGDETVDAVTCVIAVQDLSNTYSWMENSISNIRMLRIEEINDLMPAIKKTSKLRNYNHPLK